jgi:uncharacterized cupredoxin-like copper-binding protein
VTRKIFVLVASMVLSFAFLAACETDDTTDDVNGADDDPIGAASADDDGPIEDDSALDEEVEDDVATEDDDAVVEELDDDDATTDDAVTEDDDEEMNGADDGAVVEELDDDDATGDDAVTEDDEDVGTTDHPASTDDDDGADNGETIQVTLTDYEIEIDSNIEAGTYTFEVTNEGDSLHGIAIQQAPTDGDEAGIFIASTTVAPGETETREFELAEGEYIIFCPVGEHREEHDMETEITVE